MDCSGSCSITAHKSLPNPATPLLHEPSSSSRLNDQHKRCRVPDSILPSVKVPAKDRPLPSNRIPTMPIRNLLSSAFADMENLRTVYVDPSDPLHRSQLVFHEDSCRHRTTLVPVGYEQFPASGSVQQQASSTLQNAVVLLFVAKSRSTCR